MDKFVHSDNIMLNRRDLFATLQEMIHSNLQKHLRGIYKKEPYKIICAGKGGGLLGADDYVVSTGGNRSYVIVGQGVATGTADKLIYNGSPLSIDIDGESDGVYNICVSYKQIKSLTGREVMLPPKGQINTSTLHTTLTDSCEISVSATEPTDSQILLGKVVVYSSAVPADHSAGDLNADIYVDTDDDILLSTIPVSPSGWSNESGDILCVKIGNEYIKIDTDDENKITERGAYGTNVEHHAVGDTVTVPSILDMRQLSLIEMSYDTTNSAYLSQGMIKIGNSIRSVVTRNIESPLPAPLVEISQDPIIWINRSHAMGIITPEMQNAYYSLGTSYVAIDNLRAEIADIGTRLIGASESDEASLYAEQRELHTRLIEALNDQYAQLSALGNAQMSNSLQNIHNSFALIIDVAPGEGGYPVQYEAEVERMPASAVARVTSDSLEYYYSKKIYPTSYTSAGDPVYPTTADYASTVIRIPINIGEKLRVNVRSISRTDILGSKSSDVVYVFRGYNDRQYTTFKAIYDMMIPEFHDLMQTINNYVSYIKDSVSRISSMENMIEQYQSKISALLATAAEHRKRIDEMSPLTGLIPYVTSIREYFNPTPTPPPRDPVVVADEIARATELFGKYGSGDLGGER
jgi:hypothetical protein